MDKQTNVLIAEDEANIALALKSIISKAETGAKITVAVDGQEALERLQTEKYDLVISDWNMPRMTGEELLSKVRANKNTEKLPFLMLTARTDVDSVKSALGLGVSDYIAKPFDNAKLAKKVINLLGTPSDTSTNEKSPPGIIDSIIAKLKKGDIAFPVLPEMAFKAVEVINSQEASTQDVADLIKLEAGLTSKIITVANSSYYQAVKSIQDLQYAIGRIGLRDSANLILMHSTHGLFNTENPLFEKRQRTLWEHSLATACSARLIGKQVKHPLPDRLYTAGMLHDIGKMLLIQVLIELTKMRDDINEQSIDDALDSLHIEFGTTLLKRWKFPPEFIDVIHNHHNHQQMSTCSLDTQILSYADLMVNPLDMSQHESAEKPEAMERLGKRLHISNEQSEAIRQEVISYVEEMKEMI